MAEEYEYYRLPKTPYSVVESRRPPMITKGLCKEFVRDQESHMVSMCYTELEKDGRCPSAGHHVIRDGEKEIVHE